MPSHLADNTNTAVREVNKELEKEEEKNDHAGLVRKEEGTAGNHNLIKPKILVIVASTANNTK